MPQALSLLLEKVCQLENLLLKNQLHAEETDELYTITQAAKFLNLSVATIYSKVSRCEIPVNKQGKRLYFYKHELVDWIKKGRKRTYSELRENISGGGKNFYKRSL